MAVDSVRDRTLRQEARPVAVTTPTVESRERGEPGNVRERVQTISALADRRKRRQEMAGGLRKVREVFA